MSAWKVDDLPPSLRAQAEAQLAGAAPAKKPPVLAVEPAKKHGDEVLLKKIPFDRPRMNKLETAYSYLLESERQRGLIKSWAFESMKFRLGVNCWLTPDFVVILPDDTMEVRETKGPIFREDAIVKMRVLREMYPWLKIVIVRCVNGCWEIERR